MSRKSGRGAAALVVGEAIHFAPDQSAGESSPVSNHAGALQSPAMPAPSQTFTCQK